MLHLLPVTPKSSALASGALQGSVLNPLASKPGELGDSQAELSHILQQYSTLQAAAGLANNENAKTLFGGLDPSALLQLQLLQVFQHKNFKHNSELLKPLQVKLLKSKFSIKHIRFLKFKNHHKYQVLDYRVIFINLSLKNKRQF